MAARLRLLQSPSVTVGGAVRNLTAGDAALFAFLVLRGPTPRGHLAALLWAGRPLDAALANLRQRVHRINHWFDRPLLQGDGILALAPEIEHDLADPLAALAVDPQAASGPLLGNLVCDVNAELAAWVALERERWRGRLRDALVRLATEREVERRVGEALVYAERLVAEEPVHEHGVRLAMRLHHRRGDRGAALAVYERCARELQAQLGEPPSDETAALAEQIGRGSVESAPAFVPVPLALRHPPATVGREAVLAAALAHWRDGGVVLLCGTAGIGKTRVFDELLAHLEVPIVCRLLPDDAAGDLALLRRLAAALLRRRPASAPRPADLQWLADPLVHPRPAGTLGSERLARIVRDALAAGPPGGAVAVAIDDLHFADGPSVDVLCRLLPHGAPVDGTRWLLTTRDHPLPEALDRWLAERDGLLDPQIDLPPLDAAQLVDFVASVGPPAIDPALWAAALFDHCGGHPHATLQVLRALHDRGAMATEAPPVPLPMPRDAMRHVLRRLDASDPLAQQLAFVAALAGADFDVELACSLLHARASTLAVPWRHLEELGVLRGAVFSHQLVRQAVCDAVPSTLEPAIRREIAVALAAAGRSPGRRALHWEAAGEWRQAARDLRLVADESLAAGLQPKARDLLLHAAALFDKAGDGPAAFDARCRAAGWTLACDSATAALAQAEALLQASIDDRQRCQALCLRSRVLGEQHDAACLDDASEAARLAAALGDPTLLAAARLREATALEVAGRPQEALERLEALRRDPQHLNREQRHEMQDALAYRLAAAGRRREAAALHCAGVAAALADGALSRAAAQAGDAAIQLGYLCRPEEAIGYSSQAIELARGAGVERGYLLVDEMGLAALLQDVGRLGESLDLLERVATELTAAGFDGWAINAGNSLAGLFTQLGRLDLAHQRLPDPPSGAPLWARAMRRASQARLAAKRGRPALAGLEQAVALLEQGGAFNAPYVRHRIDVERAQVSEPPRARELAAACHRWAVDNEHVALARCAGMVEVDACLRAGDAAAAAAGADALQAEIGGDWQAFNFYLPDLWWTLVRAWDGAGRSREADALTAHAVAWVRERASNDVPALFRDSFLTRNPANRALLERGRRRAD